MLPNLETARLFLQPRSMEDLEACLAMDLDPEVVKYIRPTPPEDEHRAFLIERINQRFEEGLGYWSVFEKKAADEKRSFIGWVFLIPLAGLGPEIEIGYRYVRSSWGRGYASEVAKLIRDYAFRTLDLTSICAVTHPDNFASQNVLQKVGLKRQGDKWAYEQNLPYFVMTKVDFLSL